MYAQAVLRNTGYRCKAIPHIGKLHPMQLNARWMLPPVSTTAMVVNSAMDGILVTDKEIFDYLLHVGWGYHGSHIGGVCRWCHREMHFNEVLISPKGTVYHLRCAIKRVRERKAEYAEFLQSRGSGE